MFSPILLHILVCPESKQGLRFGTPAELGQINEQISRSTLKNRGGLDVSEQIQALLVRDDNRVAYLVRGDIPLMLIEESISFSGER